MNHQAIFKAHPNVVTFDDEAGALDANGEIVEIDPKKVAAAETKLNSEREIAQAAEQAAKDSAIAKLASLGLTIDDLKALGW